MKQNVFRFLADLRFAIGILLIIASSSIIGTVIEQDQSIEVYKLNYPLTNRILVFYRGISFYNLDLITFIKLGGLYCF